MGACGSGSYTYKLICTYEMSNQEQEQYIMKLKDALNEKANINTKMNIDIIEFNEFNIKLLDKEKEIKNIKLDIFPESKDEQESKLKKFVDDLIKYVSEGR